MSLESLIPIGIIAGAVIVAILVITILIKSCWKVAGTNEVLIVSGMGKVKCKTGGGIFVIPLLQKIQKMTLENIQVDFTSRNEIPTKDAIHVLVDAVANMAISKDPARQAIAASKFAGYSIRQIQETVIPVLEGNIREIISQTNFEDLIRGDKKEFAEKIQENVTPNLADLGIDLTTFNIQNFNDKNGVIKDLGVDNIEKIRKEAKIAAAEAKGRAEAEAIRAKAEAEAEGLLKKAEAMEKYGDAAKKDMELEAVKVLYAQLPGIAEAIGKGYNGAEIHLIGNDSGQLAGNMMANITQILEGFKGSTGIDPTSVLSGIFGAKLAQNNDKQ